MSSRSTLTSGEIDQQICLYTALLHLAGMPNSMSSPSTGLDSNPSTPMIHPTLSKPKVAPFMAFSRTSEPISVRVKNKMSKSPVECIQMASYCLSLPWYRNCWENHRWPFSRCNLIIYSRQMFNEELKALFYPSPLSRPGRVDIGAWTDQSHASCPGS